MLFDDFNEEELEVRSVYDEIVSNISDILDSCNHVNENALPYSFGSIDITNMHTNTTKIIEKKLKNSIEKFEQRLNSVSVSLLNTTNGVVTVEISGFYTNNNGDRLRLSFTKAI